MPEYRLGKRHAGVLDDVVSSGAFRKPEDVLRYLIKTHAPGLMHRGNTIDPQHADNGRCHSQQAWIDLYNAQEDGFRGKRMIASFDVINAPKSALPETLASLQTDCRESIIVTSTHNSYQPNTLAGKVIHHYQSKVVMPVAIALDEIPVLRHETAYEVVKLPSGLLYVKALANNRNASSKELLKNLVESTQREPEDIYFSTRTQDSRKINPEMTVAFSAGGSGTFRVFGNDQYFDFEGRSRGVSVNSRRGRAKK